MSPMLHRVIGVPNIGTTPLMDKAIKGDFESLNSLLAEAEVNEKDKRGWTALQLAAAYGHTDIVKVLLARGAEPNIKNEQGRTALMYAAAFGHTKIVKALILSRAAVNATSHDPDDIHSGETALMLAAWSGHDQIIRILLDAGADVNIKGGPLGGTALHSALWEGHANAVKALLEAPNIDVYQTNSSDETAKQVAINTGRTQIAQMLEEAETKDKQDSRI